MNNFLIVLGILFLSISCTKEKPIDYAIFSGEISSPKISKIVVTGENIKKDITISEDGTFRDTIHIDSLQYFHFNLKKSNIELYLQPGYDIHMSADLSDRIHVINYTGKGANENNFLIQKKKFKKKLNDSLQFYRFYDKPVLVQQNGIIFKNKIDMIVKTTTNIDPVFKQKELYRNQLNYLAILHKYVDYVPKDSLPDNYFDGLESIDVSDIKKYTAIPDYKSLVQNYYNRKNIQNAIKLSVEKKIDNASLQSFIEILNKIPEGSIRDDFMRNNSQLLFYPTEKEKDIDQVFSILMKSTNDEDKIGYKKKYDRLKKLRKGNPSPVFEYENFNGGTTSLKDFNGKYVFIDIWATWCKPCIEQFPHIKNLKKKYKSKNIEFVGISIDNVREKSKWKKLIKKEKLENSIQLYAGDAMNSDFIREYFLIDDSYAISIPRFILIDPKGNIVSRNTPQPTQEKELEKLFSSLDM